MMLAAALIATVVTWAFGDAIDEWLEWLLVNLYITFFGDKP
jgi:hypothetical protein